MSVRGNSVWDPQLDPVRRELSRNGTRIEVEPRVFDLLLHLIENRDRVVSKGDLIAHAPTFVAQGEVFWRDDRLNDVIP